MTRSQIELELLTELCQGGPWDFKLCLHSDGSISTESEALEDSIHPIFARLIKQKVLRSAWSRIEWRRVPEGLVPWLHVTWDWPGSLQVPLSFLVPSNETVLWVMLQ